MKNLRELRSAKGMTQVDVAVAVGVSVNAYQMWEKEVSEPKPENLEKLKEVLEIKEAE